MGINELNLNSYKPLRDIVFDNIRTAILEGVLKPGERLMEMQLAEQLGVSRTPVREAIRKLELEGLVVMVPRKGAYVAQMSKKDVEELLEIRYALEGVCTKYATGRIYPEELMELENISEKLEAAVKDNNLEEILKCDLKFHDIIYRSSKNEQLYQMTNSLWEKIYRFRFVYMSDYTSAVNIVQEHLEILNAIKAGNSELAENLARKHIQRAQDFMIKKWNR